MSASAQTGSLLAQTPAANAPNTRVPRSRQIYWAAVFLLLMLASLCSLAAFLFSADWLKTAGTLPVALHSALRADYSADLRGMRPMAFSMDLAGEAARDRQNGAQDPLPSLVAQLQTPVATVTPYATSIVKSDTPAAPEPTTALPPQVSATAGWTATPTPTASLMPSATQSASPSPSASPTRQAATQAQPTQTPAPTQTLPPTATRRPPQSTNPPATATNPPPTRTPTQKPTQPPTQKPPPTKTPTQPPPATAYPVPGTAEPSPNPYP